MCVFLPQNLVTPSDDSWRLNFAGFTPNSDINVGFGCVLRDQNAIFKAGYAAPIRDSGDATETELIALYVGLDIAQRQGVDYLEIEGDYSFVMQNLTGVVDPMSFSMPTSVRELLGECIKLMGSSEMSRLVNFTFMPMNLQTSLLSWAVSLMKLSSGLTIYHLQLLIV